MSNYDLSNQVIRVTVAGAGREQPNGGHFGAAEAHPLATHHRLLLCARQYGNVASLHGGRQQVSS